MARSVYTGNNKDETKGRNKHTKNSKRGETNLKEKDV